MRNSRLKFVCFRLICWWLHLMTMYKIFSSLPSSLLLLQSCQKCDWKIIRRKIVICWKRREKEREMLDISLCKYLFSKNIFFFILSFHIFFALTQCFNVHQFLVNIFLSNIYFSNISPCVPLKCIHIMRIHVFLFPTNVVSF